MHLGFNDLVCPEKDNDTYFHGSVIFGKAVMNDKKNLVTEKKLSYRKMSYRKN